MLLILASNFLSLGCITFLIFVAWKKGPVWWTKISHKVFRFMLLLNYMIIPGFNVCTSIFIFAYPAFTLTDDPISSWVVIWSILCAHRMLDFVTVIRRGVMLDARIFMQQKELADKSIEELKE